MQKTMHFLNYVDNFIELDENGIDEFDEFSEIGDDDETEYDEEDY